MEYDFGLDGGIVDTDFDTTDDAGQMSQDEQTEFDAIENQLLEAGQTFKHDTTSIRILHKAKSDKFVLPLNAEIPEDVDKWNKLTEQPFSFLVYNDAPFSVDLTKHCDDVNDVDQSFWYTTFTAQSKNFNEISSAVDIKKKTIIDTLKKLKVIHDRFSTKIDDLKAQAVKKSESVKQPKLIEFILQRTRKNIETIRHADDLAVNRANALENKRQIKQPKKFLKKFLRIRLGETGNDILRDMKTLGYTSKKDYQLALKYVCFLLFITNEKENKYMLPILTIIDGETLGIGYSDIKLLKIFTGHMFIHTITIKRT